MTSDEYNAWYVRDLKEDHPCYERCQTCGVGMREARYLLITGSEDQEYWWLICIRCACRALDSGMNVRLDAIFWLH